MGIPWAQPLPSSSSATGEWNLLCRVAWGFIPFSTMKSMIQCLRTGKMNKLHRHRMESIRKWVVTGIRKSTNEKGNAVTKQGRVGGGQESRMRFCYKSHLQTHIQKKWEQDRQKKSGKSKGGKKRKFRAKYNNSWAFSDTQEKKICSELTKIENNSYENRIELSDWRISV